MLRKPLLWAVLALAWLAAIGVAERWLVEYQSAAGSSWDAPVDWPAGGTLRPSPERCTLLLFVHPHCPCSRASLAELSWLLARADGQVSAEVLFVTPPGAPDGWGRTDFWRRAEATPGVRVHLDEGGQEARRFCTETSGEVRLYDPRGHLVFRGGITAARGHQGDNTGRRAILAWLTDGHAECTETPVFGCPLFGED